MSFSADILVLICAGCWVAVVLARSGVLRDKRGARDSQGARVLRGALEKRDVPDVRNVQDVRDVRNVGRIGDLKTRRGWRNRRP
ncbi:hypothetical protein NDK50_10605 [Paraburkholderia bryophila]|uniref:hypothetical protein n=1 Tax=Paraburkholderia bryophila TaxID=420952 RepID=UPI00234A115C|nr:hypothetical protein [Paraburkholderia bryophila]WCM17946.1 hypothetical protein NDK50_10605 [Paraburkholderia bryophila]